jgi:predicted nucleic acid-binding protein
LLDRLLAIMILVDINLLLYAVNEDDPHHLASQTWLEEKLSGDVAVGLSWVVILGFINGYEFQNFA